MGVPAIVMAGDSRAAKAVYGQSKVYLEVAGLPLVAHVVRTLQACPEIESVWVVGDPGRLEKALANESLEASLCKPLYVVPQQRDLITNAWETYRRYLAGDPTRGRDPEGDDVDRPALFLSGDLPLAMPEEISSFVQQAEAANVDYALGLCPAESLDVFRPSGPDEVGITVAYFNTRDGRYRQNNLHYARPARIGRLDRIEEMYELRHQRRFWNMFVLALRLLMDRVGGLKIAVLFGMMHLAGIADRNGHRRLARLLGRFVTLEINRATIAKILDTRFALIVGESGGCALDIDTEEEYDAVRARYDDWWPAHRARSRALHGELVASMIVPGGAAAPSEPPSGPGGTGSPS
ncbi:MAG TPA: NTP transferase domain-containing protein [Myxococcota bacterium]|nr:NTP transferase domain-containing protein [Myxococcota bacterium]